MKENLETRVGMFFGLAVIVAFLLLEAGGLSGLLPGGVAIHSRFNDIQDLKKGDPVKIAGVDIGRVSDIGFGTGQVVVSMKLDRDKAQLVKTDSMASIKFVGLMGQNFVSITFGTNGPPVEQDATLASEEQPDLSALMSEMDGIAASVEKFTSSLDMKELTDVLGPLGDLIRENSPKLSDLFTNLKNISSQVAEGKGTIGKLMVSQELYDNAQSTLTNLNSAMKDIQGTFKDAHAVVADLRAGKGTLGKLASDDTLYREATSTMTNMREVMEKLNHGKGSIGTLINDPSLINNAQATLQKVDKATEGLEDQGPLTVIGLAVGQLF